MQILQRKTHRLFVRYRVRSGFTKNDKRSIFAEYYLSETVLYLSDNMVPTPKHLYGGRELPLKNPNCGGFLKFIFDNFHFMCNYFSFSF